jgi:5-methylcytosine-specific restriction endonuclease McrA
MNPKKSKLQTQRVLAAQARNEKRIEKFKGFLVCMNSLCQRKFNPDPTKLDSFAGYCSKSCFRGLLPAKQRGKIRKAFKRKERQIKRQHKKVATGFYESDAWRELRFSTLRKFGFSCMACGQKPPNVVLHVDHIKPRSLHPELELNPNNIQVLCEDCNLGKSNKSSDDLRPKQP